MIYDAAIFQSILIPQHICTFRDTGTFSISLSFFMFFVGYHFFPLMYMCHMCWGIAQEIPLSPLRDAQ